jgi:hypothetical protein
MLPVADARKLIEQGYETEPRLHPCCCGAPRDDHGGGQHTGGNPATGCTRYRRDVADSLAARAVDNARTSPLDDVNVYLARAYPRPKTPRPGWGVGPSDVATCRKGIQLRERPPEDMEYDEVDETASILGSLIHDAVTRARAALYAWREYELYVSVPGLDRKGRIDQYDPVLAKITDLKTCGLYAWDRLGVDGPRPDQWKQVLIYALGLIHEGKPVEWVELEYLNRATGETEVFSRRYDPLAAQNALNWLLAINVALDMGQDLPRDRSGPSSDPVCAKYCPTRSRCWNMKAATAAGRSPESYTILGADPDMAAIEWAAENAWGWKENADEAKTEHDQARKLLIGIPGGTYGKYQVTERSRRMPEWKAWATAVRAAIDGGATADELLLIPVPKRRDVWVEVKPVRAAEQAETQGAA